MKKIVDWLQNEAKGWSCLWLSLGAAGLYLAYCYYLSMISDITGNDFFKSPGEGKPFDFAWPFYVTVLIWEMIKEEALFRTIPLGLAAWLWGTSKKIPVFMVLLLSSVGFGWWHGDPRNILAAQGMAGLILGMLFLKCGGFQQRWLKATLWSTFAHYLVNIGIDFLRWLDRLYTHFI